MKKIAALGLFIWVPALAGPVLPPDTKLADLVPGSSIRLVQTVRVCSEETLKMDKWIRPSGAVLVRRFDPTGPVCRTIPLETTIPINQVSLEVSPAFDKGSAFPFDNDSGYPSVSLSLGGEYLHKVYVMQATRWAHRPRNMTIKDLRRALGWRLNVEGPGTKFPSAAPVSQATVADGSDVKSVAAAGSDSSPAAAPAQGPTQVLAQ